MDNGKQISGFQNKPIPLPARWFLPNLGNVVLISIIFFIFKHIDFFLRDGDTGIHIRTGDIIRQTGSIVRRDPFSFSMPGQKWFAWEWLSDILMSMVHSSYGLAGVVGAAIILVSLVFLVLYYWMLARGANPFIAFALTGLAALVSSTHWLARPHLFSFGFLLACVILLENFRRFRTRLIYLLPLLVLVWANLHAAFILVFPIILIYAAGSFLESQRRGEGKTSISRPSFQTYVIIGLLAFCASFVTPYGWELHRHIWDYLNDRQLLSLIGEFQPPNFHELIGKLVELMMLLSLGAVVEAVRKRRWVDIGLLLLMTHLMLQSARHIPLAAIVSMPIIAEHWSELVRGFFKAFKERRLETRGLAAVLERQLRNFLEINRQLSGIFIYIASATVLILVITSPGAGRLLGSDFDPESHPIGAAEIIESLGIHGNIYAPDEYGDYLIYHLYPETKVFVDGRSDFFKTGRVFDDYQKLSELDPSWEEILDKYQIKWMLLPEKDPLGIVAKMSGDWELVDHGSNFKLYQKR